MVVDAKNETVLLGDNKVWCKESIIHYLISSPVEEEGALLLKKEGVNFIEETGVSKVLIDLKKSTQFSSEARKIWVEFLKHPKIEKTAVLGGSVFIKTLASFVIAASKKKNIKFLKQTVPLHRQQITSNFSLFQILI